MHMPPVALACRSLHEARQSQQRSKGDISAPLAPEPPFPTVPLHSPCSAKLPHHALKKCLAAAPGPIAMLYGIIPVITDLPLDKALHDKFDCKILRRVHASTATLSGASVRLVMLHGLHGQSLGRTAWSEYSENTPESILAYRKHWEERLQPWASSLSTKRELEEVGFAILQGAVSPQDTDVLLKELPWLLEGGAVKMEQQNKGKGGHDLSLSCTNF